MQKRKRFKLAIGKSPQQAAREMSSKKKKRKEDKALAKASNNGHKFQQIATA